MKSPSLIRFCRASTIFSGTIRDDDRDIHDTLGETEVTVALPPGVTVSPTDLTVGEGSTETYTVVLNTQPTDDVTVTVNDPTDNTDVTAEPASLTFSTSNWNTAQTVTVSAAEDADALEDTATVTHTVAGGDYAAITAQDVAVTVTDNDTPGVTVAPTSLMVDEGSSTDTYTVVLDTLPTGDVTVAISSNNTDVTVSPSNLTFTTTSWSTEQTVTVSAGQDADAANDMATLTHNPSGADYDSVDNADLAVTVTDDETAGVTVTPTSLTVTEGGTNTYTVVLDTQPTATVTVTIVDPTDNADVTANPARLTFTTSNWSTAKTVTVSAAEDDDSTEDTATVTHTVAGGDYGAITAQDVDVTVTDDDTPGITFAPTSLTVGEGGTGTYTVVLDTLPTGTVTVVILSNNTDVTASSSTLTSTLTFTTTNWNSAQTVTVTAGQDADAADDMATLTHFPSGADYDSLSDASLTVTVTDDETAGVTVTPTSLMVDEGGTNTYTVVLDTEPTGTVTITIVDPTDNTDVTTNPASLTFSTSNWATAQTVTVSAAEDDDASQDTATVTHSVAGGDYGAITAQDVAVTVTDNDTPGVTVTPVSLTVGEGSSTDTYTVVLDTLPTGNVMVAISSNNTDVTVSPSPLTFTTTSWSTEQTVTVSAGQDADAADDMATLTHNPGGANYGSVSNAILTVTVTDDETAGVTVTPTSLSINEGSTGTYTVKLDTQPTGSVTVGVSSGDTGAASVNRSTMTFTTTNWSSEQTVTVRGTHDDDSANESVTVTHTVSGGGYGSVTVDDVTVTVTDDDTPGVTASPTSLLAGEGTGFNSYTVVLNTQPSGDVTVAISSDNTDVTTSSSSLTFTTGNWNVAQRVTITVGTDQDGADESATLTHDPSGGGYDSVSDVDVVVTVDDADRRGVRVTPTSLAVNEGGMNTYTVVLDTEPTDTVTVTVNVPSNSDLDVSPPSLTFTTGNYPFAQTFTVTAGQDGDSLDDTATVTHDVSGGDYEDFAASSVTVTVNDDDTPGVTVTPTSLTVDEGTDDTTYTVVLNTQPSDDVTVAISSSNLDVTTSSTSLTFTDSNWDSAQTVTVIAGQDGDAADDTATLTHNPGGGGYNSVSNAILTVTVTDNDTRGVTVTPLSLTVDEGGTNTYTVVLDTQPTAAVTVTIVDPTDNADVSANPANLRFSTSNWATAQTVTVSAAEDDDPLEDTATVTHTVAGGDYDSFAASSVAVTVTDNDTPGVTVTPTSLTVGEGGTGRYTVRLNTLPTGNVTVVITSNNTDVTATSSSLTFTTTTWSTAQTVTVSAGQDADAANDTATLTHDPSGADYDSVSNAELAVTVTDDDTRGVTVTPLSLTVNEGGTNTYTVVLDTQPTAAVTVTIVDPTDNADVTANPASLTFFTSDWDTAQTVTVSAAEDDDPTRDTATVTHTVAGGDYASFAASSVGVTVTDNDTPGVSVTPMSLTVGEGGTNTYTVRLNTLPTGDVTVAISSNNTDVTASPSSLTFTAGSWSAEQTVTVSAGEDADAADDTATLTHNPSGADYNSVSNASVTVTVTDDETAGVTVTPTSLTVDEGGTNTYTVKLDTEPTGTVTVTIVDPTDNADVSANPASLRFSTSNWATAQTVTVSAAEDGDASQDTATVTHTVSGGDYASFAASSVSVIVTDNDTPGVSVTPMSLTVGEGGTGRYTVKLNTQPSGDVTVAISSDNTDATASPSSLTFTTTTWSTAQTVTVTAGQDDDAANDTAALTHNPSGADYASVSNADLTVTVTDDDTRGVTFTPTSLTVNEGGTNTYTVVLDTEPTAAVTVTIVDPTAPTDVTADPASLTFFTSDWDTAQTVTVSAAEDDDSTRDTATVTHDVSGGDYEDFAASSVTVTVNDDDTPGVTVTPTSLTVGEGGSGTYTVVLNTQPSGDVTVAISSNNTDVSASPSPLTFTTTTWSTEQTVTVTAGEDADAANDTAALTHNPGGGGYNSVSNAILTVTVTDDETAGVTVTPASLAIDEGSTGTYTVELNTQPTATVRVTINDPTDNTDVTASPARLTFTTSNWSTAQTVTVSAAEDGDASQDTATVTHTVSGGDYGSVTADDVAVTVTDDDTPGVTVAPTSLTVAEGGTGTYTVVLDTQPTGTVTVLILDLTANTDVTTNSSSLTFTTTTWNTAQTVTVSAAEDADAANDTATLTHNPSGADYDSVSNAELAVTVTDDDTRGVTVTPLSLTVNEGGTNTYTVVLDTQPTAAVTVTIVDPTDNADVTANPASLTFFTSDWDTAQTVTVSAVEDDDSARDTATVTHTVAGGDYASFAAPDVAVTVADNDVPGVTVTPLSLTVGEGGSGTYTVVLNTQPSGDVTVAISSNNTDVSASPSPLTFTTTTWSAEQTVTVTAGEDADAANDTAALTHNPGGGGYNSVSNAILTVTVADDETAGVTVTPTSLPVDEGGTNTYTVVLDTQPTAAVTVTIVDPTDNTDVTASPARLTFTTSNWSTAKTVTVSAVEDDDSARDTATVTHTVTGGDYASITASSVSVTVTDNDTPGVSVSPASLTVGEGGTGRYTVRLNTQPSGEVTVAISSDNTDVTASPSSLTFTATSWSSAQTVTVTAGQDDDAANDTATLTHDPSGADYDFLSNADLAVTVTDDDTRGVTVTPLSLTVNEGGTNTYTVVLDTEPTAAVTVTIVDPSDNADVTADPASLTFFTSDWDTAQTVTVSAAEDDDPTRDTATVTHDVAGGDYASFAASSVAVTVNDDDTPGVTVAPLSLTVGEGGTDTYTVVLNTQPSGDVTVAISSNNSDVTASSSSLTFTTTNWSTEQTVTVSAGQDADAANDTAALTHNPSGADYNSVSNAILTVTVTDDETAGVTVTPTSLAIDEGGTGTYTVELNTQPTGHREGHHQRPDRQRGRDGEPGETDVLDLELEHGADGDGFGGRGRRRLAGHGHGDAHRERRGLRLGDRRRRRRHRHGQRHARRDGLARVADGQRGQFRDVHRRAGHRTHGHRDGHHRRPDQHGRDGESREPDVHGLGLGHCADRHGFGGRGHRPLAGHGHRDAHRGRRGLRVLRRVQRRRHRARQRRAWREGLAHVADDHGRRQQHVHRGTEHPAIGRGDGRHQLEQHGRDRVPVPTDVHHNQLELGADGHGHGGPGRRRSERHRGSDARPERRGLRLGEQRHPGGDGHGRRHAGRDVHAPVADGRRGRHEHVHRRAGHRTHGRRDGHRQRPDRQCGRDGGSREPDVLDLELGHCADGHGFGGRGRRRLA